MVLHIQYFFLFHEYLNKFIQIEWFDFPLFWLILSIHLVYTEMKIESPLYDSPYQIRKSILNKGIILSFLGLAWISCMLDRYLYLKDWHNITFSPHLHYCNQYICIWVYNTYTINLYLLCSTVQCVRLINHTKQLIKNCIIAIFSNTICMVGYKSGEVSSSLNFYMQIYWLILKHNLNIFIQAI